MSNTNVAVLTSAMNTRVKAFDSPKQFINLVGEFLDAHNKFAIPAEVIIVHRNGSVHRRSFSDLNALESFARGYYACYWLVCTKEALPNQNAFEWTDLK